MDKPSKAAITRRPLWLNYSTIYFRQENKFIATMQPTPTAVCCVTSLMKTALIYSASRSQLAMPGLTTSSKLSVNGAPPWREPYQRPHPRPKSWLSNTPFPFRCFPTATLQPLLLQQEAIGWDQLFLGRFGSKWRCLQNEHLLTIRKRIQASYRIIVDPLPHYTTLGTGLPSLGNLQQCTPWE